MIKRKHGWLKAYQKKIAQEKIDRQTTRWRICDNYQICHHKECAHHEPHLKCRDPRQRCCYLYGTPQALISLKDKHSGCRRVSKLERLIARI